MKDKLSPINHKRRALRYSLLLITVALFVLLVIGFISSYKQNRNIELRIDNLYKSISEQKQDYSNITTKFAIAQNNFRIFTVDFDKKYYNLYIENLTIIQDEIDLLLNKLNQIKSEGAYSNFNWDQNNVLAEDFINIKYSIKNLIENNESSNFDSLDFKPIIFKKLKNKNSSSTIVNSDTTKKENYVVLKKKSLIKRIFDTKKDTLKFTDTESKALEKQQQIIEFETQLKKNNAQANNYVNKLKDNFNLLRNKERDLLANNIEIQNQINSLIQDIQKLQTDLQNAKTNKEINELIDQSDKFKWQIFFCLLLIFIMIGIIIYYQIFSSKFEKKLINEKIYASQLADYKTDILAEITHEIRTPINSLIGILDILRKKPIFDEQDKLLLETSFSNLNSTSKTINDILNISKFESMNESQLTEFNIVELVIDIIEQHKNQAELKNLHLNYKIDADNGAIIKSDELKIRQIITNLISNAIKYSIKGTITCVLSIKKNNLLKVSVIDQGLGISNDNIQNVFKKYYTINTKQKGVTGIGLGLYLTKSIVQSLNGKISFKSLLNEGSTFNVEIPIVMPNIDDSQIAIYNKISDLPKNIKLLLIDDNALNILYLKQFFNDFEHLKTATNGIEALEILKKFTADIIITDINMPIMTGDELFIKVKSIPEFINTKIIATSSDNDQIAKIEKEKGIKFDAILLKPFNEKKLANTINKVLLG